VNRGVGIFLDCVHDITIDGNVIENCSHHGIEFWESVRNCTITRNSISGCYGAIVLRDASGCDVYHNNIFSARSENPILDEHGWMNSWDSGYPGGGNYYFDYAGSDVYSGADQDEFGPDGIGDTPVVVYTYLPGDPGEDHYPLVAPYSG
jgi:parallel beta-helix repeat protein